MFALKLHGQRQEVTNFGGEWWWKCKGGSMLIVVWFRLCCVFLFVRLSFRADFSHANNNMQYFFTSTSKVRVLVLECYRKIVW